jgi:hypothetical protein
MIQISFLQLMKLSDTCPPVHLKAETRQISETLCKIKVKLFLLLIKHCSINMSWQVAV